MRVLLAIFLSLFSFSYSAFAQDSIPEAAKVLSKYLQYPSLQYQEREAAEYFIKKCREKNLNITILDTADKSMNFAASIYPLSSGKPNIVLLNHIDVVSAGDSSAWTHPPYSGKIADGYIWGRGAIDNKGMGIAQLYGVYNLMKDYKDQELPFNVTILAVSGEEMGGHRGAIPVAENHLDLLNPALILGEGGSGVTDLLESNPDCPVFGTSTVEKTKVVLRLQLDIESSGHGSVPPDEYATKDMVVALEKLLIRKPEIILSEIPVNSLKILGRAEKGIKGFVLRHLTFFAFKPLVKKEIRKDPMLASFFTNTMTLTNLSADKTDHNQISSSISAVLDCRLIPGTEPEQFIKQVKRRLNNRKIKIHIEHEELTGNRSLVPEYFRTLCRSLKEVYPGSVNLEIIFPATTDNHIFRNKGVPVYGLFPAIFKQEELTSIHAINERIKVSQLEKSIALYTTFLNNLTDLSWDKEATKERLKIAQQDDKGKIKK